MTRLAGKVALITGGGTGIGRACAKMFVREGARVVLAGRKREPLEAAAREISSAGGEAFAVVCDVTGRAQVEDAIRVTVERFKGMTTVVNNAGALLVGTAEETSRRLG